MTWEVVTNLMINGVNTTWTYTDYGKQHIESFNYDGHSYNQPQAVNCDNSLCNLPCYYQAPSIFSVDFGGLVISRDANNQLYVYINGEKAFQLSSYTNFTSGRTGFHWVSFVINEEAQRGAICLYAYFLQGGGSVYPYAGGGFYYLIDTQVSSSYQGLYNWIKNQLPVLYNWQSVPSISGKNGILSLAQIKEEYINDGESVSGASADHFTNLSIENRVDVLIDDALPAPEIGGTTVTVKYTIPSLSTGSYEYCKLVAKKNSMPESPEDGDKIINIDPTSISASVKYLRGSTKYYFEIFVKTTDGYEAVSNVKSITTGETTDIILFTDEFNTSILKSGWALDVYKSIFSSGSTGWAPTSFASDFLSSYNFLCGNSARRPLSMSNGELWTANETGVSDQTFWIPIERTYINESVIVSFDGKISPIGWSSSYYNYIRIWLGYVDDNNTWHSYDACGGIVTDQQWHNFENEIQPQFPYIDYIGLCCCDGSSHWKNIKVINV